MKASIACLVTVFKAVADTVTYPLGLQLTTDEETGGFDGTKYQIDQGVKADFVLAGEPTNFDVVHKAKGILWLKISAHGEAAHSAYPWKGKNAIWKMKQFLDILEREYPLPQREEPVTTVTISRIETSNRAFNKIPDDCVIGLDIRYIPEEANTIVRDVQALLPAGFALEVLANEPAVSTDGDSEYIQALQKAGKEILHRDMRLRETPGSSDMRHYAPMGCAGVEFGPIGEGMGSDHEWVSIPSLKQYSQIVQTFLSAVGRAA
jgi:succinyl-diaminopimelate desuccinylase